MYCTLVYNLKWTIRLALEALRTQQKSEPFTLKLSTSVNIACMPWFFVELLCQKAGAQARSYGKGYSPNSAVYMILCSRFYITLSLTLSSYRSAISLYPIQHVAYKLYFLRVGNFVTGSSERRIYRNDWPILTPYWRRYNHPARSAVTSQAV